jgi:flagellar hook-associated protein 3 FlgL
MRITTSQTFDRPSSLMTSLSQRADQLQTQLATNNRFTRPSDDATAYQRLQGLAKGDADGVTYAANVKTAQGLLDQSDSTLGDVATQLQRANEIALQGANGTLTDDERKVLGTQLNEIIGDLLGLVNTTDTRGQPLFGGAAGDKAYSQAADGSIAYTGGATVTAIPVGAGDTVQPTVTGPAAFGDDMFSTLQALAVALDTGGDVAKAAGDAVDGIKASQDQVTDARASIGARGARMDLIADRLTAGKTDRAATRSDIQEPDVSATITELQKTLTVLQATQASFTKLSSMLLFDYLR